MLECVGATVRGWVGSGEVVDVAGVAGGWGGRGDWGRRGMGVVGRALYRVRFLNLLGSAPEYKQSFKIFAILNPFNTRTHFYLEISVRLDHSIDITKGL
ncbi:hypothetical protein E2C01_021050 [Portunus trituberculatus]|uniref:Uncharacterized protein n=1 Tax=Portunus trituberculatus TaxID=210409 RepID=A0A5B7E3M4_PORTR|nr:hypothetical protein [Portunus trituberculatus]